MAITDANNVLVHTLGRSPTVADVAAHLGLTEEMVLEGLEGARAYAATSLSTPVSADESMELGDTLGDEEPEYEATELRMVLGNAMHELDEREQKILSLRFYGNLTQSDIASQIGISQMHVSRLITRALKKLRTELTVD
jgi:RNA polymerase sigma-B factor